MDLLRKYMLSTAFLRSPDGDGAVADPPAADPPVIEPAASGEGDPPADPSAEGDEPKPHGNKGKTPWYLDRISTETAARQEAERLRDEAVALAQRLQQRSVDPAASPTPPASPAQDFDTAVNHRAQQLRLNEESTAIRSAGMGEFGASFGETLAILNAVGAVSDDIVLNLVAVDKTNAHKILDTLAKDPEKAASFAKLDQRRQIAELTRMADALKVVPTETKPGAAPAPPKQVSKAPPPAPPVDPSASKVVDWRSDDASDAEFSKNWDDNFKARSARR